MNTKTNDWVSVDEHPKKYGYYLVFDTNLWGSCKIDVAKFDSYNKNWYQGADGIHPTHWQTLPEPPTKSDLQK